MKIVKLAAALSLVTAGLINGQSQAGMQKKPPQTLVDEKGRPELDLIDPFQGTNNDEAGDKNGGTMSPTAVNILPEAIKILAIIIPKDKPENKMALLKLSEKESPFVVREGDLIKVRNEEALKDAAKISKMFQKMKGHKSRSAEIDALNSFDYYLHIKKINQQFIEAFPKKSPDELIILRW